MGDLGAGFKETEIQSVLGAVKMWGTSKIRYHYTAYEEEGRKIAR